MKSSKSLVKRVIKLSKKRLIIRRRSSVQHLAGNKSKRSRRLARAKVGASGSDSKRILNRLIGR